VAGRPPPPNDQNVSSLLPPFEAEAREVSPTYVYSQRGRISRLGVGPDRLLCRLSLWPIASIAIFLLFFCSKQNRGSLRPWLRSSLLLCQPPPFRLLKSHICRSGCDRSRLRSPPTVNLSSRGPTRYLQWPRLRRSIFSRAPPRLMLPSWTANIEPFFLPSTPLCVFSVLEFCPSFPPRRRNHKTLFPVRPFHSRQGMS